MPKLSLAAQLEAILFMATEPVSAARLAKISGEPLAHVQAALATLADSLAERGIRVSQLEGTFRLVTAPEASAVLGHFLDETDKAELSRASLETLAIIAYRGPLTRSGIEQLRGVSSDTLLRSLVSRGLVTEAGRSQAPGRPMQYTVSPAFLDHFGLTSLSELPQLNNIEAAHAH